MYTYHFAHWFGFHSQFSEVVIQSGINLASSSGQESQQYIDHVQRVTELVNLHQIRENIILSCAGELHLVEHRETYSDIHKADLGNSAKHFPNRKMFFGISHHNILPLLTTIIPSEYIQVVMILLLHSRICNHGSSQSVRVSWCTTPYWLVT